MRRKAAGIKGGWWRRIDVEEELNTAHGVVFSLPFEATRHSSTVSCKSTLQVLNPAGDENQAVYGNPMDVIVTLPFYISHVMSIHPMSLITIDIFQCALASLLCCEMAY